MLITLSHRTVICQSVTEVELTDVVPLGVVSYRFNLNFFKQRGYWILDHMTLLVSSGCHCMKGIGLEIYSLIRPSYHYRNQFVTQYITYFNVWGVLSKTVVFIVNS
jgi:hypothetical protein